MANRQEDIVFVVNPLLWYDNMYPSGILCLSGYLDSKGLPNIILDSKLSPRKVPYSLREGLILSKLAELKPKVVCFSSSHRELEEVSRMNGELRKMGMGAVTIVGGSQPTYRTEDFLDNGFNFVCRGAGEQTLYEFIKEVFSGTNDWGRIKGLCWKDGGKNVFNAPRDFEAANDMNEVVVPPYHKIDPRYFDMNIGIIRGLVIKGALLLTSRGCPFDCSFCGCNLIFGRKLQFKKTENIDLEIECLKNNYGIEGLWIVDDTFTVNKHHAIEVCGVLKKHGLIWACQSRVDTIDEELVKVMKESGCVQIDFGVESGSQRILDDIIGKKTTVDQIIRAFGLAKKYKLRTFANFMIGLPTETRDDLEKTKNIMDKIGADVYLISIAAPLPGTRLYDMVGEEITPREYSLLDWNGSVLTEKLNKSQIKNLSLEKNKLDRKYLLKNIARTFFSFRTYLFFFKRGHKLERLNFVIRYFMPAAVRRLKIFLCSRAMFSKKLCDSGA